MKIDDFLKLSQTSVEEILNKEQRPVNSTQLEEDHVPVLSEESNLLKDDETGHEKPRHKRKRTEMDCKDEDVADEKGTEKDSASSSSSSSRYNDVVETVNRNPTPDGILRLLLLSTVPHYTTSTHIHTFFFLKAVPFSHLHIPYIHTFTHS